jgi:hypothetical protein
MPFLTRRIILTHFYNQQDVNELYLDDTDLVGFCIVTLLAKFLDDFLAIASSRQHGNDVHRL